VGKGAKNVVSRFGSESQVTAENVEAFVAAARKALGDEAADVKISFGVMSFPTGHDLEVFLKGVGVDVAPAEVEQ